MGLLIPILMLLIVKYSSGLNNGLGLTPQMGWNSWEHFGCGINETIVRGIADAMVATGLSALGYEYVNLDDCWQSSRDAQGIIQADPNTFPSGIPSLVKYVNSRKLKLGLYSDRGYKTCQNRPGSLGYETKDANTYAAWGVDYLKQDSCDTDGTPVEKSYSAMRDALNASGRAIFYSLCGSVNKDDLWAPNVGNSWRTSPDIHDYWNEMTRNIDINNNFAKEAGPGGWNDPDMLQIGNGHLNYNEYVTWFSLWSITKSPLIIGSDIRNISNETLSILKNTEAISVNQDKLGKQGKKVAFASARLPNASGGVIIDNCLAPAISDEPSRRQWTYNAQDGSIRSVFSGRCLSIDRCNPRVPTMLVLDECQIGDPKALCQGKNQQWTINPANHRIVSRLDGQCAKPYDVSGPIIVAGPCNGLREQSWAWNETDGTIRNNFNHQCLMVQLELEVWAGPLADGSQAVVLLNRASSGTNEITVQWSDIGFSANQSALVRDLWAHKDIDVYRGNYTSPKIGSHSAMMLKITPVQSKHHF